MTAETKSSLKMTGVEQIRLVKNKDDNYLIVLTNNDNSPICISDGLPLVIGYDITDGFSVTLQNPNNALSYRA